MSKLINFEDFTKVDLRVGTIIEVNDFPEARNPSYKVKVDFGEELGVKKSCVHATHYPKDELIGRQVICVVNFPPKQIGNAISEVLVTGVDTEKVYAATFGINAALCGVAGALISITFTLHPYVGLPYTVRSFMIVIIAGLGNLPGVALSGMGLGVFEEFADYILGTEFRIGSVFLLLVLILVYRRFKLSRKREYLK